MDSTTLLASAGVSAVVSLLTTRQVTVRACLPKGRWVGRDCGRMSRVIALSDAEWARIEPLMPSSDGQRGGPVLDHRQVVEAIVYRFRTGVAWRDLPASFGPWQTAWKRHKRFSVDGTWDRI